MSVTRAVILPFICLRTEQGPRLSRRLGCVNPRPSVAKLRLAPLRYQLVAAATYLAKPRLWQNPFSDIWPPGLSPLATCHSSLRPQGV